jgi:hypothetical protein
MLHSAWRQLLPFWAAPLVIDSMMRSRLKLPGFCRSVGQLWDRPYSMRSSAAWGDEFKPGGGYMANTWQGIFPVREDTPKESFMNHF